MRWCGCKIRVHGAANQISLQDPWRSRPWVHSRFSTNLRQSFLQSLRDDSPWERFRLNTPISLRLRIKLICIFSADHENVVYRKLIIKKPSQPPQQSGCGLRRYRWSYSVLDVFVRLSSSWASAYDFLLSFAESAWRSSAKGEGENIQIW